MNDKLQNIATSLFPFVVLGISIALLIGLITMFFYVLVWGIFIGGILWIGTLIKNYFFPKKLTEDSNGRIIEHDSKK